MNVSLFPAGMKLPKSNKLENITLRGFGGGWNAVETDLQMESTYLVTVRNWKRTAGGTQKIRFGSKWFATVGGQPNANPIIDMEYFAESLICVCKNGNIVSISGSGEPTTIWSQAIAAALPFTPAGWSNGLDSIDFVAYKNELIIHNGIDKPITISRLLVVTYLQDLASGSNVNVPIGAYGCVVSNYHCVAGIAPTTAPDWVTSHAYVVGDLVEHPQTSALYRCLTANTSGTGTFAQELVAHPTYWITSNLNSPTLVYVSAVGTAGTFPNDPAPNDSITIDVGAFAPQGAVEIRGIAGFRANLLVFFQDQTVIVKLGVYNAAGKHEPFFPDTMPTFGILGHRCVQPVENDLLFSGLGGMASARRNLLSVSGTLESQSLSERIEPPYRSTIGALADEDQLKKCWMVYDALGHDMLLFTPFNGRVFVYSFSTKLKYSAWSEFSNLNVQCGCRSFLGRVFYADGFNVYHHGNAVFPNEDYFKDRILDRQTQWINNQAYDATVLLFDPDVNESFVCLISHTSSATGTFAQDRAAFPTRWQKFDGNEIDFELELPWLDSKDPMRVKFLRFLSMATKGSASFTVSAYVDNLYKNEQGEKVFGPQATMEFIGNEAVGFGLDAGPYGGGRRSDDPRLYKFPARFKKIKFVLSGIKAGALELVNMSFLFSRGKYKR